MGKYKLLSAGILFSLAVGLTGCAKETPGKVYSPEDVVALLEETVDYNGTSVKTKELLESDKSFYACADVVGDVDEEIGLLSGRFIYIIDPKEKKVVYEGINYENLVNYEGKRGILYERVGGAPNHVDYQFSVFDDAGALKEVCTWSMYDADSDGDYDENDEYEYNYEDTEYEKWKEMTEE